MRKSKSKLCDALQRFIDLEGDGEMRDCPNCYNQYTVDYKACLGCSEVYPQNWRDVSELIDELKDEVKRLEAKNKRLRKWLENTDTSLKPDEDIPDDKEDAYMEGYRDALTDARQALEGRRK